jgi:hypothetical protein
MKHVNIEKLKPHVEAIMHKKKRQALKSLSFPVALAVAPFWGALLSALMPILLKVIAQFLGSFGGQTGGITSIKSESFTKLDPDIAAYLDEHPEFFSEVLS